MGATDVVPFIPWASRWTGASRWPASWRSGREGLGIGLSLRRAAGGADRVLLRTCARAIRGHARTHPDPTSDRIAFTHRGCDRHRGSALPRRLQRALDTTDLASPRRSRSEWTSSGGLPGVQASGFAVDGIAQSR
jgi:hypothetical protein